MLACVHVCSEDLGETDAVGKRPREKRPSMVVWLSERHSQTGATVVITLCLELFRVLSCPLSHTYSRAGTGDPMDRQGTLCTHECSALAPNLTALCASHPSYNIAIPSEFSLVTVYPCHLQCQCYSVPHKAADCDLIRFCLIHSCHKH